MDQLLHCNGGNTEGQCDFMAEDSGLQREMGHIDEYPWCKVDTIKAGKIVL